MFEQETSGVRVQSPKEPHYSVSSLAPNGKVRGFYILQSVALRMTGSGKPFLSAAASDKTGTIPMVFWDYNGSLTAADDGKIVYLSGIISEFRGALQITLDQIRRARPEDPVDLRTLVPVAPIDEEKMYRDILDLVHTIEDEDYRDICLEFLQRHGESFRSIPAAKSIHHGFLHGLLMHTGYMLQTADYLAGLYPDVIDRSLLLAGTLLHDFSKREEFTFSELGLVADYSVKGQLLGHLVMAAEEAAEIGKELHVPEQKSVLLQHLLLAHHGKPEYGAAVVPMCAESELLSMIDNLDSRMEIYRENLEQTPLGEFSGRVFALDNNRIYHHYKPETK